MTIKEYTVTDKVLTYLKQYDDLGHTRIKMPYTVNQFSNLINETYEELKFKCSKIKLFKPRQTNRKVRKQVLICSEKEEIQAKYCWAVCY